MAVSVSYVEGLSISEEDLDNKANWVELGSGAFSTVYRAWCDLHNCHVAVKQISRGNQMREVEKLFNAMVHDHIVSIKGFNRKSSLIIMEYCPYSLQGLRDKLGDNFIPWPLCITFMQHIMSGLEFLHYKGIVHRDLKPGNVMVTEDFICKIADFGLAKAQESHSNSRANSGIMWPSGTPVYLSPQCWENPGLLARESDDIYSCGILMYKMITNEDVFFATANRNDDAFFDNLKHWVLKGCRPKIENIHREGEMTPPIVEAVITACWDADAANRMTSKYWAGQLREFITGNISGEDFQAAKNQLRQLLSGRRARNGPTPTCMPSSSSSKSPSPETEAQEADKQKEEGEDEYLDDHVDSHSNDQPQRLISREDQVTEQMSNLCVNGEIDVTIFPERSGTALRYRLEELKPYKLGFDQDTKQLVFHCVNGNPISISDSHINSYELDPQDRQIIYLGVTGGLLKLSVSSLPDTVSGLAALSILPSPDKETTERDLRTYDYYEQNSTPGTRPTNHDQRYGPHPNRQTPSPDNRHYDYYGPSSQESYHDHTPKRQPPPYNRLPHETAYVTYQHHPLTTLHTPDPPDPHLQNTSSLPPYMSGQQPQSIQITNVENFYNCPPVLSTPPVRDPVNVRPPPTPPYSPAELTRSTDMVTTEDILEVYEDVAQNYDLVGRRLGMEGIMGAIQYENTGNIAEASYKLIYAWVNQNGSDATKASLAIALYKAKLYNAAKRIL